MQYLIEGENVIEPMGCTKCNKIVCSGNCYIQGCNTQGNCGCKTNFCGGQICAPAKMIPVTKLSKGI